jgi:protein TonB
MRSRFIAALTVSIGLTPLFPISFALAQVNTSTMPASAQPNVVLPVFVRKPDPSQMSEAYPARALKNEKSGVAQIHCIVAIDGKLTDCKVVSETPLNYGFGDAAVRVSKYFEFRPKTVDGHPVGDAEVTVPVTWSLRR